MQMMHSTGSSPSSGLYFDLMTFLRMSLLVGTQLLSGLLARRYSRYNIGPKQMISDVYVQHLMIVTYPKMIRASITHWMALVP